MRKLSDSELFRKQLEELIINFESDLKKGDLRQRVLCLIPIFQKIKILGKSLISIKLSASARERILFYFRKYPFTVINGNELLIISGIQEWARRIRELRVQYGWNIVSGVTVKEIAETNEFPLLSHIKIDEMKTDDYILLSEDQDRDAAFRWNLAYKIRNMNLSVRSKILKYFNKNIGKHVTCEELRYVAKDRTEWARRVRELRTEYGWPIVTKQTGRPDLPIGIYLLESDRQYPEHDRNISDRIRRKVLRKDKYRCTVCNWSRSEWNPDDPRHLEIHHVIHHVMGGENIAENLKSICNICHDEIHS